MTDVLDARLRRLIIMAGIVPQAHLGRLAKAHGAIETARSRIAALDPGHVDPADVAMIDVQMRYQQWADMRRERLVQEIARNERMMVQLRADAARSFARCHTLTEMAGKQAGRQPS